MVRRFVPLCLFLLLCYQVIAKDETLCIQKETSKLLKAVPNASVAIFHAELNRAGSIWLQHLRKNFGFESLKNVTVKATSPVRNVVISAGSFNFTASFVCHNDVCELSCPLVRGRPQRNEECRKPRQGFIAELKQCDEQAIMFLVAQP